MSVWLRNLKEKVKIQNIGIALTGPFQAARGAGDEIQSGGSRRRGEEGSCQRCDDRWKQPQDFFWLSWAIKCVTEKLTSSAWPRNSILFFFSSKIFIYITSFQSFFRINWWKRQCWGIYAYCNSKTYVTHYMFKFVYKETNKNILY